MPRLQPLVRVAADPDPRLARLLWPWLGLGLLAVLLLPHGVTGIARRGWALIARKEK